MAPTPFLPMPLLDLLSALLAAYAAVGAALFVVHAAILPPAVVAEVWRDLRSAMLADGLGRLRASAAAAAAAAIVLAAALCVLGEWVLLWPFRLRSLLEDLL